MRPGAWCLLTTQHHLPTTYQPACSSPSPRCCVTTLGHCVGTPSAQKPLTMWISQVGSALSHSPHSQGSRNPDLDLLDDTSQRQTQTTLLGMARFPQQANDANSCYERQTLMQQAARQGCAVWAQGLGLKGGYCRPREPSTAAQNLAKAQVGREGTGKPVTPTPAQQWLPDLPRPYLRLLEPLCSSSRLEVRVWQPQSQIPATSSPRYMP